MRNSRKTNGLAQLTPESMSEMTIQTCTLRPPLKDAKKDSAETALMLQRNAAPRTVQPKFHTPQAEIHYLKAMLSSERRRHGQVEGILIRYAEALESNLVDLRSLYMQSLKLTVGPKVTA